MLNAEIVYTSIVWVYLRKQNNNNKNAHLPFYFQINKKKARIFRFVFKGTEIIYANLWD